MAFKKNCLVNLLLDLLHAVASGSCIRATSDMEWLQVFGWSLYCTPFWTGPDITAKRAFRAWNHSRKMPMLLLNTPDWTHFFSQAHPCIAGWYLTAPGLADLRSKSAAGLKFCFPCSTAPVTLHSELQHTPSTPQAHSPRHTWLEYQLSPLRSDVCSLWLQPLEAPPAPHLQEQKPQSWEHFRETTARGEKVLEQSTHRKSRWPVGLGWGQFQLPAGITLRHWAFPKSFPLPWCCSEWENTWFISRDSRLKDLTWAHDPTCSTRGPRYDLPEPSWTNNCENLWRFCFTPDGKRVSQLWCFS